MKHFIHDKNMQEKIPRKNVRKILFKTHYAVKLIEARSILCVLSLVSLVIYNN